tara:strand:- start:1498 stop:2712 length:1215 start_codon:yes stop_codon:yes gene_type:complete
MKMNLNPLRSASFKIIVLFAMISSSSLASDFSFTPSITTEFRYFPESPAYEGQLEYFQPSIYFSGEGRWLSKDRKKRLRFEPFLRFDVRDDERSHFDIRELNYSQSFSNFDLLIGNAQIFWGVAESRNAVDVINQFDEVENSDETDKLGQPLVRFGKFTNIGRFEFYYLPYFRERTFPGRDGRQRGPITVDLDNAEYDEGREEWTGDFALRYQHQVDQFDIGIHVFTGTARAPLLTLNGEGTSLIPIYQKLTQGGVDIQRTLDAWLLKLEVVVADQSGDNFISNVLGLEYTFFNFSDSGIDIGILLEGLYDNRDENQTASTLFENDIFAGARFTWNDFQESELLLGAIIDWETGSMFSSIEYERRIGENMKFEVEAQYFLAQDSEPLAQFERDTNLTLRLSRYY